MSSPNSRCARGSLQAARDGYLSAQIAGITRHRDRRVLDGYIRAGGGARDIVRVM
jgi:hypothetical protein